MFLRAPKKTKKNLTFTAKKDLAALVVLLAEERGGVCGSFSR
jgi:hypothetical protein